MEEFEESLTQKKMKIPKMSIRNSGNSENSFGEDRMPLRHKKVSSLNVHWLKWAYTYLHNDQAFGTQHNLLIMFDKLNLKVEFLQTIKKIFIFTLKYGHVLC